MKDKIEVVFGYNIGGPTKLTYLHFSTEIMKWKKYNLYSKLYFVMK